jgi:tRNA threonylcarbamoyl adenosine modification protein (Sua5/YciO/YrdC/YwlC family)
MLLRIHPDNPDLRQLNKALEVLRDGGVIIYPTDGVYAFGCDATRQRAVEKVARLKGIKPEKADFSLVFADLSHLSDFSRAVDTRTYKLMKSCLPGPYTFILNANNNVPKLFRNNKKTIGIRIPDNNICRELARELGNPLISSSVHDEDEIVEYTTDPSLIHERYEDQVDLVIDGGYGLNVPSTIIDCTGDEPVLVRRGAGEVELDDHS